MEEINILNKFVPYSADWKKERHVWFGIDIRSQIEYIDFVHVSKLNFDWWDSNKLHIQYWGIQRLQRRIRRRHKRNKAARIIQAGCENWLYKPICRDNTMGIVLKIGLKMKIA